MFRIAVFLGAFFYVLGARAFAEERAQKVADEKFWAANVFFVGSVVYDVESTFYGLDKCDGRCYEANPFMRPFVVRGHAPTYAVQAAVGAPLVWASYRLKKRGSKWWWVIPVAAGAAHTAAGTWNVRLAARF